MIVHADCLEHMRTMDANSVDAIVTDPPYGLSFMGKGWDKGVPGIEFWRAAITVLKPGAYLLAFGGTRTFHRMAVAIEDAGFEIHDTISWLYGSGFPKHKSKLKPAWEPIIVARKPAPKATPLNVDACRIEGGERPLLESTPKNGKFSGVFREGSRAVGATNFGRWPANVVLDDEAAAMLDAQSGERKSGGGDKHGRKASTFCVSTDWEQFKGTSVGGDTGGASRFFYTAKASRSERNAGLEGMPERESGAPMNSRCSMCGRLKLDYERSQCKCDVHIPTHRVSRAGVQNHHPTVKPISLMRWLVRLVTPPGGLVLDPFAGSGTTGCAASLEGFQFIGIEREAEYVAIAERRIAHWSRQPALIMEATA